MDDDQSWNDFFFFFSFCALNITVWNCRAVDIESTGSHSNDMQ